MKKRILCLLLAAVMVFAMASVGFAAAPAAGLPNFKKVDTYTDGYFPDVTTGHWYYYNVKASYEMGLMLGKTVNGKTVFAAADSVSIAETIALAARIHSIYHTGSAGFVQGAPWYQVYVDYAVANGIIEAGEYSNYTAKATRAQFSTIMAASVPESALQPINDVDAGEVHDLPHDTAYAKTAYLLYNAGIITGTDSYGTFKANAAIRRDEAVTIVTRIVDPSLRKSFEPAAVQRAAVESVEVSGYRSTRHMLTDVSGKVLECYHWKEYAVGQGERLRVTFYPAESCGAVVWASSNPAVASVSEYGWLEIHQQGEAEITVTAAGGAVGILKVQVPNPLPELQYALTADGKGYEITGCDPAVYAAHIPASYNGLPVVSIKGGAFKDCKNLRYFTVDPAQTTFYAEDGVVFTDRPEKTLVAFPPNYDLAGYYYVPVDTVAVADYAFAGIRSRTLNTITMQEGLKKLGDRVFFQAGWQIMIYLPESLTEIGEDLLLNQTANIPFYAYPNSVAAQYATQNKIPVGLIRPFDGKDTAVEMEEPVSLPVSEATLPNPADIVYVPAGQRYTITMYDTADVSRRYDLSDYEQTTDGEVRLMLETQWSEIIPDANGNTLADFPHQTGLYGAGYTESAAIVRAYDRLGNLVGWQKVSGDFAFSYPGAYSIGVEGGTSTVLTVLPVKPVFISGEGYCRVDPQTWIRLPDGNISQYFVVCMLYPTHTMQFAMHTNLFSSSTVDTLGTPIYRDGSSSHYGVMLFFSYDASRADQMSVNSIHFDGLECVWEDENIRCMMSGSLNITEEYGQNLSRILQQVKDTMLGTYFPESIPIRQITVDSMSSWNPNASKGNISLPADSVTELAEDVLAHEMVHAVDQQITVLAEGPYAPSPWFEGRAEYISAMIYRGDGTPGYYDWSFLSEEDRADFFHYYYYSTNRNTEYGVGHWFFWYLCKTYGEDVSVEIMSNIAALPVVEDIPSSEITPEMEEQWAQMFKKCVEDATEVGVFQNFVRDVIEK